MLMSKSSGGEALLQYAPSGVRVLRNGQYVICAMSGVQIPLEELRYWSAVHQEPYATAQLATERLKP